MQVIYFRQWLWVPPPQSYYDLKSINTKNTDFKRFEFGELNFHELTDSFVGDLIFSYT